MSTKNTVKETNESQYRNAFQALLKRAEEPTEKADKPQEYNKDSPTPDLPDQRRSKKQARDNASQAW